jgi:hypothetical protein
MSEQTEIGLDDQIRRLFELNELCAEPACDGCFNRTLRAEGLRQAQIALAAADTQVKELEAALSQPNDSTGRGRLLLNAYGRRCYEAGEKAAEAQLASLSVALHHLRQYAQHQSGCPMNRYENTLAEVLKAECACGLAAQLDALTARQEPT